MSSNERPLYRSAMFVAVKNDRGEFLLQRRAYTGFMDGYYDLASGHLEYGESCEECAIRETKEEYGLDVAANDLRVVAIFQSSFEPNIQYLNVIYLTNVFAGKPSIGDPEKIDDIGWFAPDEFPDKLTVGAKVFLMSLSSKTVKNYYIGRKEYEKLVGEEYEQTHHLGKTKRKR